MLTPQQSLSDWAQHAPLSAHIVAFILAVLVGFALSPFRRNNKGK